MSLDDRFTIVGSDSVLTNLGIVTVKNPIPQEGRRSPLAADTSDSDSDSMTDRQTDSMTKYGQKRQT